MNLRQESHDRQSAYTRPLLLGRPIHGILRIIWSIPSHGIRILRFSDFLGSLLIARLRSITTVVGRSERSLASRAYSVHLFQIASRHDVEMVCCSKDVERGQSEDI